MNQQPSPLARPRHGMGFPAFVTLMAALMATNALAIDIMLPALAEMAQGLAIASPNDRQWIVTAYLLGFGVAQLAYGPLSDRFGRKPVLLVGLSIYVAASILAVFAGDFRAMMIARVLQGIGAAGSRVLAVAIVRDCYAGREMARVMSLTMIVFLAIPILAPSIGQAILLLAPWRGIFGVLVLFGGAVMLVSLLWLPETLAPPERRPISLRSISAAIGETLTTRIAVGYMAAMAAVLGGLFGFINSAQQIFTDVFALSDWFPLIFAGIASSMAAASLINARIVGRLGMRRVSHGALIGFIAITGAHALVAIAGHENIWSFALLQAGAMFCFSLMTPNFGALAMDPLGHIAGTASSVQGFTTTVAGAVLGFAIGQHFDGSVVPFAVGMALCGWLALAIVLAAERGRLFTPAPGRS